MVARTTKRKTRSGTLQGLSGGRSFSGTIAGEYWHCTMLGKGAEKKLRCKKGRSGPGRYGKKKLGMSRPARARAGVKSARKERATVSVPKAKALRKSGTKKGRPYKGCRLTKSGAKCTPTVAKRLGVSKKRRATKKRRAKKR